MAKIQTHCLLYVCESEEKILICHLMTIPRKTDTKLHTIFIGWGKTFHAALQSSDEYKFFYDIMEQ